jgi:hypothetical protein
MEKQFPIIQNRRSVTLRLPPRSPSSLLPPPNWKLLDLSLQTNLPDTRDGPHLSHGSVSSPSKLSPQGSYRVRTEFVGLKSVSDRSLGTLVFIGAAALWVPRSQRDVSLHVWQLGKLSPPAPHTTTCHIRRRLVVGTHSGEPETDPHSAVRQRGISKPARRVEAH